MSELIQPARLKRKAIVYIRQSTPHQVVSNQKSLRLQYAPCQCVHDPGNAKGRLLLGLRRTISELERHNSKPPDDWSHRQGSTWNSPSPGLSAL